VSSSQAGQESVLDWWRKQCHFLADQAAGRPVARCAVVPFAVDSSVEALAVCEFATGKVSTHSLGRFCSVDGCYCSPAIFKDSKVFCDCDARKERLASLAEPR
jgi:hypothetical protein